MNAAVELHITYRNLRLLAGGSLVFFPVIIVLLGAVLHDLHIWPTLSHYYFAEAVPGLLRTLFTGFLILLGGLMLAYRGFDWRDDAIHSAGGVFAILVALCPKYCDEFDTYAMATKWSYFHAPSAALLFVMGLVAAWYRGGENLKKRLTPEEIKKLHLWGAGAIVLMLAGGLAYFPYLLGFDAYPTVILIVEMFGFFGFGIYWVGMTHIISIANERIEEETKLTLSHTMALRADSPIPTEHLNPIP